MKKVWHEICKVVLKQIYSGWENSVSVSDKMQECVILCSMILAQLYLQFRWNLVLKIPDIFMHVTEALIRKKTHAYCVKNAVKDLQFFCWHFINRKFFVAPLAGYFETKFFCGVMALFDDRFWGSGPRPGSHYDFPNRSSSSSLSKQHTM